MKKRLIISLICMICMVFGLVFHFAGSRSGSYASAAGSVVRLGYAEVREYNSFAQVLLEMARELVEEGSIEESFLKKYEDVDYEQKFKDGDTVDLWNDICDHNRSDAKYQFVREAFFDMNAIDEADYPTMVNRDDVDVTFAMGTAPGVYFAENEKKNKFMNMYAADPIESGIIKSSTERFSDNAFATVDLTPYIRQLDAGYKFLKFKKLGVVYENSEAAYGYSSIATVMQKAKEYNFQVVEEYVDEPVTDEDYDRYYKQLKKAYRKLVKEGIDCLYITVASIDYESMMQELLDDAIIPAKVMTLAQDDFFPVEYGALFGVTISDAKENAIHVIRQLRAYGEDGVPFNELDMVCEITPKIGLNFTTAKRIGFNISFEDLQMVDKVYRSDK